jgi:hypothetical protein
MKSNFSDLNKIEQNALHFIKNKIADHIKPLLIFCWNSRVHYTLQRNCFTVKQETKELTFSCNLLVVMPQGAVICENMHEELSALTISYGAVHAIIHTVDFMSRKMKEHNLFFNWVHRSATLIYERDNSLQQLPAPIPELEEYKRQADCYYSETPEMLNYLEEKLNCVTASFVMPCIVNNNIGEHSIGMIITKNYVEAPHK